MSDMFASEATFGSQIEDVEAIHKYMISQAIKTPAGQKSMDEYKAWYANSGWWDRNMSSTWLDSQRSRRNSFELQNATTQAQQDGLRRVLATSVTSEELRGEPRPNVDLATGAVGSMVKASSPNVVTAAQSKVIKATGVVPPVMSNATPAGNRSTIRQGSTGPDVVVWQKIIGVSSDGKFGPGTAAATRKWQSDRGLVADAIVGPKTWAAAYPAVSGTKPASDMFAPASTVASFSPLGPTLGDIIKTTVMETKAKVIAPVTPGSRAWTRNLKLSLRGEDVKTWQSFLGLVPPTGNFDALTDSKTRAYQSAKGLTADGIVGQKTWTAAFGTLSSTAPSPFAPAVKPAPTFKPPAKPPVAKKPAEPVKKTIKAKVLEAGMLGNLSQNQKIVAGVVVAGAIGAAIMHKQQNKRS